MEALAEIGQSGFSSLVNLLFGTFVFFGGLALLLIAIACHRMGIEGYRRMAWFALLSLFGGLWTFFDPVSILPFLPYPEVIYTISALTEHGIAIAFVGYLRTCAGPRGVQFCSVLLGLEALMVLVQVISHVAGGWTMFQFTDISVGIQIVCLLLLIIVFVLDSRTSGGSSADYRALLVFAPFAVGIILAAVVYFLNNNDGDWFGVGFVATLIAQVGFVMSYIKKQADEAARAQELERELAQSKITLMISQIQPHFLYNALNTIQYLCEDKPQVAAETTNRLAKYLRGIVDSVATDVLVPITRDLQHLENFLVIVSLRFPHIEVVFDVKDTDFTVPPLTLQPLVENAIRHGLGPKGHKGLVSISIWEEASIHHIKISDNGVGFDRSAVLDDGRSHIGLKNTEQRLAWMCQGTLEVKSSPQEGTTIHIRIPKKIAGTQDRKRVPQEKKDE